MSFKPFCSIDSSADGLDMDRRGDGNGTSKQDDNLDLSLLASIVHNCIQEDKLSKLRATLKRFTGKEQRYRIVSQRINGNAPLFTASFRGKVHFVNFLLDECGADVEQTGIYQVEEDHSHHEVTPLWCAAVTNQLECVKALIRHGADVNSPSDTDSTPVRSACLNTNIPLIKYLVEHGANIHKPNIKGATCLINSVQNADLCQFLINKGASVNAKDIDGSLALHYAIREARTETVKLLLRHGSDYKACNGFGDDALRTAALSGYPDIEEIILQCDVNSATALSDPLTSETGVRLLDMGYEGESVNEAVLAVRRQKGRSMVTVEEVLSWILYEQDRRLRRRAEIRPAVNLGVDVVLSRQPCKLEGKVLQIEEYKKPTAPPAPAASHGDYSDFYEVAVKSGPDPPLPPLIEVWNYNNSTSDDALKHYFENEKRSGGGDTTDVTFDRKQNFAQVTFKDKRDTQTLEAENQKLRNMQICKICMDKPVYVTFLPCGHFVCCQDCAPTLKICPICRMEINGRVNTFMS